MMDSSMTCRVPQKN